MLTLTYGLIKICVVEFLIYDSWYIFSITCLKKQSKSMPCTLALI